MTDSCPTMTKTGVAKWLLQPKMADFLFRGSGDFFMRRVVTDLSKQNVSLLPLIISLSKVFYEGKKSLEA